ncbi:zinc finger protein ZAT5-like [Silene latifolia]|uniref:zinc finger protein ZAT5-like n=1 Tax=Silene latifolia TaxID=37657 RepID=UPI003D784420
MVAQQEGNNNNIICTSDDDQENVKNNMLLIFKGKRTKRARPCSPLALTMSTTSVATEDGASDSSGGWAATSEEEEDMAHCLILLAQGSNNSKGNNNNGPTSYECKTCNRSFPSFQALGGHRASHKKPKLLVAEKLSSLNFSGLNYDSCNQNRSINHDFGIGLTLQTPNSHPNTNTTNNITNISNKVKVHECGICGAEFASGQALGGHMRRHRPIPSMKPASSATVTVAAVATKNILSLDLNLPAPEEDLHQNFVFGSNDKTLVFTAASLVDCHY